MEEEFSLAVCKGEHLLQMHLLAYKYHWGYKELMSMPRQERKLFYDMVLEQINAENESVRESSQDTPTSKKTYAESS